MSLETSIEMSHISPFEKKFIVALEEHSYTELFEEMFVCVHGKGLYEYCPKVAGTELFLHKG